MPNNSGTSPLATGTLELPLLKWFVFVLIFARGEYNSHALIEVKYTLRVTVIKWLFFQYCIMYFYMFIFHL